MRYAFSRFAKNNKRYFVCSFIYYILASFLLGGKLASFILAGVFYAISLAVMLSPLGEKILRALEHVRELETKREKEYLEPIFSEVLEQAKLRNWNELGKVEICVIERMSVEAIAIGVKTVAVSKGAIETFSEDELKALIAHEIAHIVHGDTVARLYAVVGNGLFTAFVLFTRCLIFLVDVLQGMFSRSGFVKLMVIIMRFWLNLVVIAVSFLLQLALAYNSRENEYRADNYAYRLGYGEEMTEALYLLEKIQLGDNSTPIQKMLAEHPRVTSRIKRLEAQIDLWKPPVQTNP